MDSKPSPKRGPGRPRKDVVKASRTISLPPDLWERIDALATQRGVTRSDIMGEAAELLLAKRSRRAVRP